MKKNSIVDFVLKVEEISKVGIKYSTDPYALDNYKELQEYAKCFLNDHMDTPLEGNNFFKRDIYPTPNVSVRTVIFNSDKTKVLLVQERMDSGWSLPGGWTELTLSPSESALKELSEEAGAKCEITRLIGVLDRYENSPTLGVPEYIIAFEGKILSETDELCHEILAKRYFRLDELPNWSKKNDPKLMEKIIKAGLSGQTVFD